MNNINARTEMLIGKVNMEKIKNTKVLLLGLGGVGGYTFESLVRSGIENIDIVDNDIINETNINRQILADYTTIGQYKVDVAINRAKIINPNVKIHGYKLFYTPQVSSINLKNYDYIIDAIDNITAKCDIIKKCNDNNINLISCMGTGNKLDAAKLRIDDIYNTYECKLAKVIRKFCKDNKISKLTVVFSNERQSNTVISDNGKYSPASISYVPAVAGLLLTQYVIKDIIKDK